MDDKTHTIRLNTIDFTMFTMEDVVTAQGQMVTVRFVTRHRPEEMRTALRKIFFIYPRLRAIIEPTLFSYRLRVLEDDARFDVLFNDAFHVKKNLRHDSDDFLSFRRDFYNEPFALEQGLAIKFRYLPDDEQPVLLMNVHHMITDGVGCQAIVNALLAILNGKDLPASSIDNPNRLAVLLNGKPSAIPKQLYASLRKIIFNIKTSKGNRIIPATPDPVNFFGPVDMHNCSLAVSTQVMKERSKELGCSINTLFMAALVITLSRNPARVQGNCIGINMPVDLRRFFPGHRPVHGNFAIGPMIVVPEEYWDQPQRLIHYITEQVNDLVHAITHNGIAIPSLLEWVPTLFGRKIYAQLIRMSKAKGLLVKTAAFSNLGNVDSHNEHGASAQICESISTTTSHGLFLAMSSIDNTFRLSITYQLAEFTRAEIIAFVAAYEQSIMELITGKSPEPLAAGRQI